MIPQPNRAKSPCSMAMRNQQRPFSTSVDGSGPRTVRFSKDMTTDSSRQQSPRRPSSMISGSNNQSLVPVSNNRNNNNNNLTPRNNTIAKLQAAEVEATSKPLQPQKIEIAPGTDLTTVKTIDDLVLFGGQASFGLVYEHNLYERVHRYMDIMAIDDICYYGDSRSSVPSALEKKFSLFKPMTFVSFPPTADQVIPGEHTPAPIGNGEYHISSPLQLYFQTLSRNQVHHFQHIIINWSEICAPGITLPDLERLFYHAKRSLIPSGKILCIIRPGDATTLPLFAQGIEFLKNTECPNARSILAALQTAGFNVHWSIDILPAVLPVRKWLSMIRNCIPAQLSLMDKRDLNRGVVELSEGMFRYQPNLVEFSDRLLFIIASPETSPNMAVIQRLGTSESNDLTKSNIKFSQKSISSSSILFPSTIQREAIFEMPVDDTVRPYVEKRLLDTQKKKKLDRREYGFF